MPVKKSKKKGFFRLFRDRRGWGYPDIFSFYGSVFPSIIPVLTWSALWTYGVCYVYIELGKKVIIPIDLAGSVAVVVGLLLAFRTNNAYDRYYEGRKLFSFMCTQIRNCTRNVWVGVTETSEEDHVEKLRVIKLLLGYAVAVKHHLRLEFGTEWEDLRGLLPPGLQLTQFDGNAIQRDADMGTEEQNQNANPNGAAANTSSDDITITLPNPVPVVADGIRGVVGIVPSTYGLLRNSVSSGNATIYYNEEEYTGEVDASMSLPLEIIMYLGLYFDQQFREGKLDGPRYGSVSGCMGTLIDILGNLERIGNTPIPHAYNVHLKQAVTLYVWSLPFALVDKLLWYTIPCVALVAFVMFGVEAIGAEIENPFGYDKNDLPLDDYCKDLEAEVNYLQRHIPPKKTNTTTTQQ